MSAETKVYHFTDLPDHPLFIQWVRFGDPATPPPAISNGICEQRIGEAKSKLIGPPQTLRAKENEFIIAIIETIHPWKITGNESSIIRNCYNLYKQLLTELETLWQSATKIEDKGESSYKLSMKKFEQLKLQYASLFFQHPNAEIEFFREIKPRFAGLIEFFILLYQAILFHPSDPAWHRSFWQKEKMRYIKFYEHFYWLISYWASGNHDMDTEWFLRKNNDRRLAASPMYDTGPEFMTSCDHYLATFIGQRLYYEYVLYRMMGRS